MGVLSSFAAYTKFLSESWKEAKTNGTFLSSSKGFRNDLGVERISKEETRAGSASAGTSDRSCLGAHPRERMRKKEKEENYRS